MRHSSWLMALALLLLVIFPIVLHIWISIPEIFRRAPYEDWDEICGYNHTRQMAESSFERAPAYGSLDTLKFILARRWHKIFDKKALPLQSPLWANGVPESFRNDKLLLGPKTWGSFAAIDYNYARGICDRSVIITTRKISFILTYLFLAIIIWFIIYSVGFHGIAICIPLTCFLFTYGFRYSLVRALPGAQTAILAGAIFFLLLTALKNKSVQLLHVATAVCAISTNFKTDSLMLGLPIFLTYLLVHIHTYSGIAVRSLTITALAAVGIFATTIALTNIELIVRPLPVIKSQLELLFFVGSGKGVDLAENVKLFGSFLHENLVSLFLKDLSPDGASKWLFALIGLAISVLCLTFARSPAPGIRASMIVITIVTLLTLWGIPILCVPKIIGRYFVPGLIVSLLAFGIASYLFVSSNGIQRSFPIWCLLLLAIISCLANSVGSTEASRVFRRQLAENSGLDPAVSRNRAILAMWDLLKTGTYNGEVVIDQHSYTDLRFLFDRHVPVVMITAWNYREVFDGLKGNHKPVLGLHVPGAYDDETVPSWVGKWTPTWEKEYDEFHDAVASLPRLYNFDGMKMKLLDWSPVQENDSVFIFRLDPRL
jgi:hypothetical protein